MVTTTDPLLGTTIGERYVIEALIGEGAMGRVYRAHHRALANQRYAIKVLLGDLAASSTMRLRFAREAANASKLDHPNVVNVIDYGRTERGLNFLVMDLVEGCSLATLVQNGPIPAERAIRIAHQLCEGLEHAHSRGVIHRDFKSDNIMIVGEPGREIARIADFGLAMSTAHDVRLTTSGVACTPAYAAPEQLRGHPFDHRVDLYGLGATLFEMLSGGYLPFEGDLNETVRAKLTLDAPSVVTRAPNVPPGLVTLVGRLLAYNPDDRPRSARAVIRALETSLTLPRPQLRTVDMRPIAKRRTARRKRLRGALFGTTLVALAVIVRTPDEAGVVLPQVQEAAAAEAPPALEAPTPVERPPDVEPPPAQMVVAQPAQPVVAPPKVVAATRAHRRVAKHARPRPAPRIEPAADRDVDAVAEADAEAEATPGPTASTIATKYGTIGRQLQALEAAQGIDSTTDLWPQYRQIEITDAMATPESRDAASNVLDEIERAITERQQ